MGSIVYQFWCPPDVKRFASAIDYVAAARNANVGSAFHQKLQEMGMPVLEGNYRGLNEGRFWSRMLTFVLYSLGFILLSLPSMNVFVRVAEFAVYSLWAAS